MRTEKQHRTILDHVGVFMAVCAAIALVLYYIKGLPLASGVFIEYHRRDMVFIAAFYLFIVSMLAKRKGQSYAFFAVAVLYNPLISFVDQGWFANRIWLVLDCIAMLTFMFVR